jgi:hypothetical protein
MMVTKGPYGGTGLEGGAGDVGDDEGVVGSTGDWCGWREGRETS